MTRQLLKFFVVGILTVIADYLTYIWLISVGVDLTPAKATAFITGSIFAFIANKYYTFQKKGLLNNNQVPKFVLIYLSSLIVNTFVNTALLGLQSGNSEIKIKIAFVVSTSLSASINYLGMKYYVFE